jgi:mRNA interferase MazF
MGIHRFEVYLVSLDPTTGHEIKKTRPCVIISPDEMNKYLKTVIVAPLTTKCRAYLTRIPIILDGKEGEIVLDQIRTVDKSRLVECLGKIDGSIAKEVTKTLLEMFAE